MTTIATDGRTMAADSRVITFNGRNTEPYICRGFHRKLWLGPMGILGIAGEIEVAEALVEWFRAGMDRKHRPRGIGGGWEALLLTNSGRVYCFDGTLNRIRLNAPAAVGSGAHFALGAMAANANAHEAVKIARGLDPYTGGRILWYSIR